MKQFIERTFNQKVRDGQIEPRTDFFGTSPIRKMVEIRWTRTGKVETVEVRLDITPDDPFEGLTEF